MKENSIIYLYNIKRSIDKLTYSNALYNVYKRKEVVKHLKYVQKKCSNEDIVYYRTSVVVDSCWIITRVSNKGASGNHPYTPTPCYLTPSTLHPYPHHPFTLPFTYTPPPLYPTPSTLSPPPPPYPTPLPYTITP